MSEKSTILIVDDDATILKTLKEALTQEGYVCETASDGDSALARIHKGHFDFLLTDIKMPGTKGFELTEKVKKISSDISVIIMTGYVEEFSYDRAIEAGASDFIKKPFTLAELFIRLRHVKMQEKFRRMSITDELTGLLNRRGFFPLAEKQLKNAKRLGKRMILLFADFDDLKRINDDFGHREGDKALILTADIIKETFRESDILARLGGDEFVVLIMAGRGFDDETVIKRLQDTLTVYNRKRKGDYALSVSAGSVFFDPDNPCSIDELLKNADSLMYQQKQSKKGISQ